MKSEFYDYEYFVKGTKGGAGIYLNDAIIIVRRLKKWGIKGFLDMACGTGVLIAEARRNNIDAYGCDFSEYAIEYAVAEAKPYMFLQDITKPFKKENIGKKFEWVLLYGILEHLENEEQTRLATFNALELLETGGKIYCLICEEPRGDEPSHHLLKPRDWWISFFSDFDLRDVSVKYFEDMGEIVPSPVARDELFILERK